MTDISEDELARWMALANAATAGPWMYEDEQLKVPDKDIIVGIHVLSCCNADDDTMAFIAATRDAVPRLIAAYRAQVAELERERMRLAACGVIALANTPQTAAKERAMLRDYWSGSCQSVADAVDREIALEAATAFCEKCQPNGGVVGTCQRCALIKLSHVIGQIDYVLGEPNEMEVSLYDVDGDEDRVLTRVKAELAAGRRLAECVPELLDWLDYRLADEEWVANARDALAEYERAREGA